MQESVKQLSSNIDQLLKCAQSSENIADKITSLIVKKEFAESYSSNTVYDVLIKNWKYSAASQNLKSSSIDPDKIYSEMAKWKCADIVMAYHHPDLGVQIINPKNPDHKEFMSDFRKNELLVIYAGYMGKKDADNICDTVLAKAAEVVNGKFSKVPESLLKGSYGFKKEKAVQKTAIQKSSAKGTSSKKTAAKTSAVKETSKTSSAFSFSQQSKTVQKSVSKSSITGKAPVKSASSSAQAAAPQRSAPAGNPSLRKMTPMISVPVTNELFHNGNVEAWKRIIASFQSKYPDLQIFVYYDGERITDINSLFKWGKVKHGSCIQFVVVGENIQDVAKLKRYFTQGASNMFEAFLQGAPGTILRLF